MKKANPTQFTRSFPLTKNSKVSPVNTVESRKVDTSSWLKKIKGTFVKLPSALHGLFFNWFWHIFSFTFILLFYLTIQLIQKLFSIPLLPVALRSGATHQLNRIYQLVTRKGRKEEHTINRISLIDLAIRNMLFKKSRAVITIGGMAIGIGIIVFLVSIGYGLQQLVINRVARLDELMQADVSTQPGSKDTINDQTLSSVKELPDVKEVLPLIAGVARVSFQNSVTDMAVYGVTTQYLKQSAIKPIHGDIFDSNEIATVMPTIDQRVAGVSTTSQDVGKEGDTIGTVEFAINEDAWLKVRAKPTRQGEILGYTRRQIGQMSAELVWGGNYPDSPAGSTSTNEHGQVLGRWLAANYPLWKKESCSTDSLNCVDGQYVPVVTESGQQKTQFGYIAELNLSILSSPLIEHFSQVLGVTTDATSAGITQSDDPGWVEIASESGAFNQHQITKVEIKGNLKRQAVVNQAMLKVLSIPESEAVGKTFEVSYILPGELIGDSTRKVESAETQYQIVAVIPEEKTPYFYVPFLDIRSLGVINYSQLKVVVNEKEQLATTRKQVEAMGYSTRSVADTIKQIDRLFATLRSVLTLIGMVALAVAALGMFNTLTVSLLERTREVGLMKAMGMKSHEVQELFLTESMVMGFFGGILGIAIGTGAGELLSLILSIFSLSKGIGYLDISYLPPSFIIFIFLLSLFVGIFTGIYPAKRATRISALNALRYE